jgi:nucleotide-binding universal stress UspA family protein
MPIVATVDRSARAVSVIRHAADLAEDAGVELHVVHVGSAGVPSPEGGYDSDRERRFAGMRAGGVARELGGEVEGVGDFETVGLEGDPAEALLEYAREVDAECVVVSGRKRSPLGQAVFGSVTRSLLLHADLPVVAVPHEGT